MPLEGKKGDRVISGDSQLGQIATLGRSPSSSVARAAAGSVNEKGNSVNILDRQ